MVEGVVVDGGGVRGQRPRALSPRLGERAGNPSRAGVKLQDEQLRPGERTAVWDSGYIAGRRRRRWRRGGGRGRRHFHRSPVEEDEVQRRPSLDLGATDGGR